MSLTRRILSLEGDQRRAPRYTLEADQRQRRESRYTLELEADQRQRRESQQDSLEVQKYDQNEHFTKPLGLADCANDLQFIQRRVAEFMVSETFGLS